MAPHPAPRTEHSPWGHPCDKAWFDTSGVAVVFVLPLQLSCLYAVLWWWAVGSPLWGSLWGSATPVLVCRVRADALAERGAAASGKPLLINQIRHVMALITINILARDDEDAVQSLSDSK